jgi:hypothetical protein
VVESAAAGHGWLPPENHGKGNLTWKSPTLVSVYAWEPSGCVFGKSLFFSSLPKPFPAAERARNAKDRSLAVRGPAIFTSKEEEEEEEKAEIALLQQKNIIKGSSRQTRDPAASVIWLASCLCWLLGRWVASAPGTKRATFLLLADHVRRDR